MFKSPHTGNLGESHAGGRSAVAIRLAVMARSSFAARAPCQCIWSSVAMRFTFAMPRIMGMRSAYTIGSVLRDREGGSARAPSCASGVRRATGDVCSVIAETYRHFGGWTGRGHGSKRLKALVIGGRRSLRWLTAKCIAMCTTRFSKPRPNRADDQVSRAGHGGQRHSAERDRRAAHAQSAIRSL